MRIYFLGIGGTLMGSLAQLAKAAGHEVSGSDKALYPPMSDQLAAANIQVFEGLDGGEEIVAVGAPYLSEGMAVTRMALSEQAIPRADYPL